MTHSQQPQPIDQATAGKHALLNARQAMQLLRVSYATILSRLATREIKGYFEGNGWVIPMWAIEEYQQKRIESAQATRDRHVMRGKLLNKLSAA